MPAFNFHQRFANDVECGRKQQTIRTTRRGKAGETAYLYTGQRTANCRKLGEAPLVEVLPITIERSAPEGMARITLDGAQLIDTEAEHLAQADGFLFLEDMARFFESTHGALPYSGYLHRWTLPEN